MAHKRCRRAKKEREMACLHRFHRPEQSLSQGLFPIAAHRHVGGRHSRTRNAQLYGRIFRLQPNTHAPRRPRKNIIHNRTRDFLLQSNAVRTQERRGNLSMPGKQDVP